MKHSFLAYMGILSLATAINVNAQTSVQPFVPGSTPEGVCYYLPQTGVRVVLTVEKEVTRPGEFAKYAFKYLRMQNVPTEESVSWTIKSIELQPYGQPDRSKAYTIALKGRTSAPLVSLSREGLILAINADVTEENLPKLPDNIPASKPDDARKYMNQEMLQVTSTSKQAELVAQEIYEIRDSRNALIRGEADNTPKDGQQLKLMLDNLERQETAFREMFTGTHQRSTHIYTMNYVPKAQVQDNILLRFSRKLGPLAADDLAGEPVYVSVKCAETMPPVQEDEKLQAKKAKLPQAVRYNIPVLTDIEVHTSKKSLAKTSIPMAQFGRIEVLSNTLFDKKTTTQVTFFQSTGAIKDIVE